MGTSGFHGTGCLNTNSGRATGDEDNVTFELACCLLAIFAKTVQRACTFHVIVAHNLESCWAGIAGPFCVLMYFLVGTELWSSEVGHIDEFQQLTGRKCL
jgi:hypothetical protein